MASTRRRKNSPATKLTEDLVAEILCRLPAKSFFRFQCVSKSWLALTSDPLYQNKLRCIVSGLFHDPPLPYLLTDGFNSSTNGYIKLSTDCTLEPTLSFLPHPESIRIVDCCNGLLLCRTWLPHSLLSRYCICNPTTKKWAALPDRFGRFRDLVLAFDPRRSPHYHVLHFKESQGSTELEIYSSKTGEWGRCQPLWNHHTDRILRLPGVYHEGIIYKLALASAHNLLVGVDVEREVVRRIDLPNSTDKGHKRHNQCIGFSGGYLHYARKGKTELQIWVLKDLDGNQWSLKHRADIKTMVEMSRGEMALRRLYILALHPDGNVVYLLLLGKLFVYHLNNARLEEACTFHLGRLRTLFVYTPCFSDCVSVH